MSIRFFDETGNFNLIDEKYVKRWITAVITSRNMTVGNINYLFCDDKYLIQVNRQYLNHDTYTDIITFDYVVGSLVSGDILISVERVKENASILDLSFEEEMLRVLVHGVLHLLGQEDKTEKDAREMRSMEKESIGLWRENMSYRPKPHLKDGPVNSNRHCFCRWTGLKLEDRPQHLEMSQLCHLLFMEAWECDFTYLSLFCHPS